LFASVLASCFIFRFVANDKKSQAGNDDEVDLGTDVIKPTVTSMTSQSSGGCGHGQATKSAPIDHASVVGDHHRQQNQQHPHPARTAMQVTSTASADELRKKVEQLDEKNALTDIVIRQLSEQIARLQSYSPVAAATTAAIAMATTSAPPSAINHGNVEVRYFDTRGRSDLTDTLLLDNCTEIVQYFCILFSYSNSTFKLLYLRDYLKAVLAIILCSINEQKCILTF